MKASAPTLRFEVLGQQVVVQAGDAAAMQVIAANFAALAAGPADAPCDLHYRVAREASGVGFNLRCPGLRPQRAADLGELLFLIEKHLTVALQRCRPDLLFFHAAALERGGRVYLLAGESGHGKSTTAWGLLHHGFRYLSDELAPLVPGSLQVHAYPHALGLKRPPPTAYALPPGPAVLDLQRSLHVPVAALPAGLAAAPLPLAALILVHYQAGQVAPRLQPLGRAEAAARLYLHALNALAHPAHGLDAVLRVASGVPCFALQAGELAASCLLLRELADGALPATRKGKRAATRAGVSAGGSIA